MNMSVPMKKETQWYLLDYYDRKQSTPYENAPIGYCPNVPTEQLPDEWRMYWEGWNSAGEDLFFYWQACSAQTRGEK